METLTVNRTIELTTNNLNYILKSTDYIATLNEEHSIFIKSNNESNLSMYMFNINTEVNNNKRQRFIITTELDNKQINIITYYNIENACNHLLACATDLM